ncbi:universal stress protein [Amycolatopsis taiwanensis]|uniref:Universal stress protein n=1 Tax=Amycolatopsis taiwanensis TaxID=342230 RepID=A0A9W6R572_9PSEU|nr:universal stress protein [Amycolatopsis taiwanensis]GLY67782.1 universal stress protein [Amycolatopsis taiwanensis]
MDLNDAPVVVGVDGSPASRAALRWAVTEAAATGREVRAVAAWSYAPALEPGGTVLPVDEMAAAHRRTLDEVIARTVGKEPGVKVDALLIEGDPVDALLEASKDASLLALGSHGRGLLMTALLGSVSARCLRRATCPVLIFPAQVVPDEPADDLATSA